MATSGTKLELTFNTNNGSKTKFNYAYINPEVETAEVQALVTGMIANGSIFEEPPISISQADLVTTSITRILVTRIIKSP